MTHEAPKCHEPECMSRSMKAIGGIGKHIDYIDEGSRSFGVREVILYQCETCKRVEIQ